MSNAPVGDTSAFAHAKINLALAVSPPISEEGPRKGWHSIASWMAPIGLGDTLTIRRGAPGDASAHHIRWADDAPRPTPIDWPITKDLAVRAHHLLEREAGRPLPLRLRMEKRTPVGGGLGGGSSDAAAALLTIDRAFGLGLTADRLAALSRELGSDVAFFLDGGGGDAPRPALVEGFGDRIARTPRVQAHAVLILPPFGCATPAVYKAFDSIPEAALARLSGHAGFERRAEAAAALARAAVVDPRTPLFNDLAPAAELVAPGLAEIRAEAARATETPVHITGSGSTCFQIARDAEHAAWLAGRVREHLGARGVGAVATNLV